MHCFILYFCFCVKTIGTIFAFENLVTEQFKIFWKYLPLMNLDQTYMVLDNKILLFLINISNILDITVSHEVFFYFQILKNLSSASQMTFWKQVCTRLFAWKCLEQYHLKTKREPIWKITCPVVTIHLPSISRYWTCLFAPMLPQRIYSISFFMTLMWPCTSMLSCPIIG